MMYKSESNVHWRRIEPLPCELIPVDARFYEKACRMLEDPAYERKLAEVTRRMRSMKPARMKVD